MLKQIQRSYSQGDVTDAAAVLGPEEDAITFRRAASRNLNARKMIRSEPAFSDEEEEDNFQIIEEDFQIVEEHDSAMDVEDEPPRLPTKKKGDPLASAHSQDEHERWRNQFYKALTIH